MTGDFGLGWEVQS